MAEFITLMESEGKIRIVELAEESVKIKGLGVLILMNCLVVHQLAKNSNWTKIPHSNNAMELPELISGMARRAQTISSKDAGQFISRLGVGG